MRITCPLTPPHPLLMYTQSLLRTPAEPPGGRHALFEHFWLERGPLPPPAGGTEDDGASRKFVLTPSVTRQLCNVARAVLVR
jgi:midasin